MDRLFLQSSTSALISWKYESYRLRTLDKPESDSLRKDSTKSGKLHLEKLKTPTDDKFIEVFCLGIEDRSNLDFKVFLYENRKLTGAPREAIDNLLKEAERRQIPLSTIAEQFAKRAFSGNSFISNLCAPKSWRKYEIHATAAIIKLLESQGVIPDHVEFDARIIGKITKSARQVDLFLKKDTPKKHYVACEVKNYEQAKISVEKVEAFATKIKDVNITPILS